VSLVIPFAILLVQYVKNYTTFKDEVWQVVDKTKSKHLNPDLTKKIFE
jgi:hypothetical protein